MTTMPQLSRRDMLETLAKAGAGVLLTPMIASAASLPAASLPAASLPAASLPAASLPAASLPAASLPAASLPAASAGPMFSQELPPVSLDGWKMTALEITYAPGQVDRAHRHIGFVFGYVLEGDLRFKIDGGEETTYHTGQMFYEKPGTVHRVSANASITKPCRFLAMVFVDKTKPLTEPV